MNFGFPTLTLLIKSVLGPFLPKCKSLFMLHRNESLRQMQKSNQQSKKYSCILFTGIIHDRSFNIVKPILPPIHQKVSIRLDTKVKTVNVNWTEYNLRSFSHYAWLYLISNNLAGVNQFPSFLHWTLWPGNQWNRTLLLQIKDNFGNHRYLEHSFFQYLSII